MLENIKNIKTTIGLSALSITIAYLLADKLVDAKVINTDFSIILILSFIFIFILVNFLFVIVTTKKEKTSYKQTAILADDTTQNIEDKSRKEGTEFTQKALGSTGSKQSIKKGS